VVPKFRLAVRVAGLCFGCAVVVRADAAGFVGAIANKFVVFAIFASPLRKLYRKNFQHS